MDFKELGLSDYIVQGLSAQGIVTATEIQSLTLPLIKSGADVIGLSQTGSGKTYAYGIPALEHVNKDLSAVQFLIVCPTRELAAQVADDLRKLTSPTSKISIAPIFGGSSMDRQVQALKRGAKIVIGTPGRLMDHLRRKTLRLDYLKMVILDEADEMLNMGFKEDIETILKATPQQRQTVMFSATMPPEISRITKQYMKEPVMIKSKGQESAPTLIKQYYINCNKTEKTEILERIYEKMNPWISVVFCNTKTMTEELAKTLSKKGLPAVCLHGDMRQSERKRTMDIFKKNDGGGILVATDVAARGIDIKNVDIVINYDFPNNEDYYVHRIGRTGRAGKEGTAFTLINTKNQSKDLYALASKTGGKIEEYASLSTTSWSNKECFATSPRTNQGARRAPRTNREPSGFRTYGRQSEPRANNGQRSSRMNSEPNSFRTNGRQSGPRADSASSNSRATGRSSGFRTDNGNHEQGFKRSNDGFKENRSGSFGRDNKRQGKGGFISIEEHGHFNPAPKFRSERADRTETARPDRTNRTGNANRTDRQDRTYGTGNEGRTGRKETFQKDGNFKPEARGFNSRTGNRQSGVRQKDPHKRAR